MAYNVWNKRTSSRNWALGASPLRTLPKGKLPAFKSPPVRVPSFLWLNLATAGLAYGGFLWLTQAKKKL